MREKVSELVETHLGGGYAGSLIEQAINGLIDDERDEIARMVERGTLEAVYSADAGSLLAGLIRARGTS